ncbi:MAG: carbon-nitrogen hydrolase family protein [Candidatus Thermoplasmatota archaeon]
MKIALSSMRPKIGGKKSNLQKMKEYINKNKADLFIFGEMSSTGYTLRDEVRTLAEKKDGNIISKMKKTARKNNCHIIFGMPIKHEEIKGLIHNAAVLIYPDGKTKIYKKWFLPTFGPFEEKIFYDEGQKTPVFNTEFGKIGIQICYDIYFPEISKAYSLQGTDLIVCISASPSVTRQYFEKILPARAIENTTFIIYSNIVGSQEDLVFWGGSQIYDPLGNLIDKAPYFKESLIISDIDLGKIKKARANRPVIRDTRPEIYQDLYNYSREK